MLKNVRKKPYKRTKYTKHKMLCVFSNTKLFNYFKEKTIIYISHKQEIIEMFNEKYKLERSKV